MAELWRLVRFRAKACPGLDPGWKPVRVKKTRQIKNLEPRFETAPLALFRPAIAKPPPKGLIGKN